MQKRNKKKIVIGILCCMLVFMGIGYAALSQVLNIGTTAKVTGSWKIYISSATVKEKSDADMNGTEITDNKTTDISLNVSFKKPSDYITYDITVENAGTIDAKLDEITMTPPSNVIDGTEEKMFLMETQNLTKGSVLKAGETATFQMTLRFNEKATALPSADEEFTFGLKLNYVQLDSTKADTSGTGGGTIPAEAPDFTVDSNGRVVAYNESKITTDADGYLIVPEKNSEGKVITKVNQWSFAKFNVVDAKTDEGEIIIIYTETEEEYLKLKAIVEKLMNGDGSGSGSGSENMPIYWSKEKETPSDDQIEGKIYCNPETGEVESPISKIDLTNAKQIEEIEDHSFDASRVSHIKFNEGLKKIGDDAFLDSDELVEIQLPSTLETIGADAFMYTSLTNVIIPKNVVSIGSNAFGSINSLKTITIKRANSDGMTLGSGWNGWNGNVTVVYDPS